MSATASRTTTIVYSGDVAGTQEIAAADNDSSPAVVDIAALTTGANTITVKTGATAVTIVPPSDNTASIVLKGITGDTGVGLLRTDPTTIALDPGTASFVLTVGADVTVRLFWT